MRTTKSTVTFRHSFCLNEVIGEQPAGTYDVEVDEEEMVGLERTAYRRVATLLYIRDGGSTRTCTVDPNELAAALARDAQD